MTKTIISGALTNKVTLTSAIYGNPVTVASGATISVASGGALDGASPTAWTLVNQGAIESGNSYGVYLHGGGTVTNQSGGTISGQYGVRIAGGAASLVNAGGIIGTTDAVLLATGFTDTLTVDPGAAFSGTVDGGNTIGATHTSTLELASGAAAGTLTGLGTMFVDFAQVAIDAGATWTLTSGNPGTGGTFTDAGTLINAGSLGTYVTLLAGAYLLNQATATIVGGVVGTGGASRVTNLGSISSSGSGVFLQSGGTVFNGSATDTTALISASGGGVVIEGGGTVDNDGTIMDSSFAGVFIAGGGTVINGSATNTSAVIASGNTGLEFQNSATVINYGTISGVGVFGVVMASGSVTNSGTILGGNGVAINGAGAVVNTGEISASSSVGFGVRLAGQGTVTNGSPSLATASIYSAYIGVLISNGSGTVTNYGTIIGSAETGIDIQPTGLVINGSAADTSAVVTGGSIGVDLAAGGMIANDGTISGAGFAGIFTSAHANVTNGSSTVTSALITSDTTGAELNGNSTLVNYGTIQDSRTNLPARCGVGEFSVGKPVRSQFFVA